MKTKLLAVFFIVLLLVFPVNALINSNISFFSSNVASFPVTVFGRLSAASVSDVVQSSDLKLVVTSPAGVKSSYNIIFRAKDGVDSFVTSGLYYSTFTAAIAGNYVIALQDKNGNALSSTILSVAPNNNLATCELDNLMFNGTVLHGTVMVNTLTLPPAVTADNVHFKVVNADGIESSYVKDVSIVSAGISSFVFDIPYSSVSLVDGPVLVGATVELNDGDAVSVDDFSPSCFKFSRNNIVQSSFFLPVITLPPVSFWSNEASNVNFVVDNPGVQSDFTFEVYGNLVSDGKVSLSASSPVYSKIISDSHNIIPVYISALETGDYSFSVRILMGDVILSNRVYSFSVKPASSISVSNIVEYLLFRYDAGIVNITKYFTLTNNGKASRYYFNASSPYGSSVSNVFVQSYADVGSLESVNIPLYFDVRTFSSETKHFVLNIMDSAKKLLSSFPFSAVVNNVSVNVALPSSFVVGKDKTDRSVTLTNNGDDGSFTVRLSGKPAADGNISTSDSTFFLSKGASRDVGLQFNFSSVGTYNFVLEFLRGDKSAFSKSLNVTVKPDFDLMFDYDNSYTIRKGRESSFSIRVKNLNDSASFDLDLRDVSGTLEAFDYAYLNTTSLSINTGAWSGINFNILVPEDYKYNSAVLELLLKNGDDVVYIVPLNIKINQKGLIHDLSVIKTEFYKENYQPGDSGVVTFKILNSGDFDESVYFATRFGEDIYKKTSTPTVIRPGDYYPFSRVFFIDSGESHKSLNISLALLSDNVKGSYEFSIPIFIPVYDFAVSLSKVSAVINQGVVAPFDLIITNLGNIEDRYSVKFSGKSDVMLSSSLVSINPDSFGKLAFTAVSDFSGSDVLKFDACSVANTACKTALLSLNILAPATESSNDSLSDFIVNTPVLDVMRGEGVVGTLTVSNDAFDIMNYSVAVSNVPDILVSVYPGNVFSLNSGESMDVLFHSSVSDNAMSGVRNISFSVSEIVDGAPNKVFDGSFAVNINSKIAITSFVTFLKSNPVIVLIPIVILFSLVIFIYVRRGSKSKREGFYGYEKYYK